MCLKPIDIINPTKRISRYGGTKLKLSVPCNQCAECLNKKRDEYAFRTYHHCKSTIEKGGYVLFDTLTYADEHLPHISDFVDVNKYGISDFSCFNLDHYKLFFKRLRSAIKKEYGLVSAISYLFASEYGTAEGYTHRPHYHFLLFVNNPRIHPLWLSRKIAQCWQFGRTDGIVYKPLKYVAEHIYGYDLGFGKQNSVWILRAVTQYVSKYITKSSEFQSRLNMRIHVIQNCVDFNEEEIKIAVKSISQFSRISSGYGIGYLSKMSERDIELLKDNSCMLPDKKKVTKILPLPMYYIRKLYYECVDGSTGKKVWQLTEKGISHFAELRLSNIDANVSSLIDLLKNATPQQRAYCDIILDGRTLTDYSIYKIFYAGRMRDYRSFNLYKSPRYGLSDYEDISNVEWHERIDESTQSNTFDVRDTYVVDDDNKKVFMRNQYCSVISNDFLINKTKYLSKKSFVQQFTFNEKSCYEFRNYDLLTSFFDNLTKEDKMLRQKTYEFNRDYENRMKLFNLL